MRSLFALVLGAVAITICSSVDAGTLQAASSRPTISDASAAILKMKKTPLAFTKNMGQWDERVLYRAVADGVTMWFTKDGVTYQLARRVAYDAGAALGAPSDGGWNAVTASERFSHTKVLVEHLVLEARFDGANPDPEVVGEGLLEFKCNYFTGNDPAQWQTDVPSYSAIVLKDIYPGISVRYSDDGRGQAAYEFAAQSGADMKQVKVVYEGADEVSLDADGKMVVRTKWGDFTAGRPLSADGVRSGAVRFSQLPKNTIGLEEDGASQQALSTHSVVLSYSTYLGGSGSDKALGIAVDGSDCAYVTGFSESSDFPTLGSYQTDIGYDDVFVTKLSSAGNSLVYSTYLGGESREWGNSIAVDGNGNAYVTGWTESANFPTQNPFQGRNQGLSDAFAVKLSNTGNSLIYSTFLGGGNNDWGYGIAVDGSGSAYVTGNTHSLNFPTLSPFQPTNHGPPDVFVTKLSSAGYALIYSTLLGGGSDDWGSGIAVDGSGCAYVTGYTHSFNFPTSNPMQTYQGGGQYGWDAFVTKLSDVGNRLVYSTYLGGSEDDHGYSIAVDGSGCAYVTGFTRSSDFPTSNPFRGSFTDGDMDAFVTKLSAAGISLIYSTFLGGGGKDGGYGIAVDGNGYASVTGNTESSNFPTLNPYQTAGGIFATKLDIAGSDLIYGTYLGGRGDYGHGIAVDGSGTAYVTGWTSSGEFATVNPYQSSLQHVWDAFVTKLGGQQFVNGDVNSDGSVDMSDAVYLIGFIFTGGPTPNPTTAGDVNCDSFVDISDVVYLSSYIFFGGPAPNAECK
jgi:hypothetical protein